MHINQQVKSVPESKNQRKDGKYISLSYTEYKLKISLLNHLNRKLKSFEFSKKHLNYISEQIQKDSEERRHNTIFTFKTLSHIGVTSVVPFRTVSGSQSKLNIKCSCLFGEGSFHPFTVMACFMSFQIYF